MCKSWKTPQIVEVAIGLEINSYACADLWFRGVEAAPGSWSARPSRPHRVLQGKL